MKRASFLIVTFLAVAGAAVLAAAQTPIAVRYAATTDNVGMSDSIRVELFRWSTDKERDALLDAWKLTAAPPAAPVNPAPEPEPVAAAPDAAADNPAVAPPGRGAAGNARGGAAPARGGAARGAAGAGRGGANARGGAPARGGAARGGRGDGAGADAAPTRTPEGSLAAALSKAETVGRIWSSEAAGYSIRYAVRLPQPDGGERIVLITDRRLNPDIWKPASGSTTNYDFTVIEARLSAKGAGEAKGSLTGKLTLDTVAGTLALENYAALPVILKNLERR